MLRIAGRGAAAYVASAPRDDYGDVPDEWVFGRQRSSDPLAEKENRQREYPSLHPFPHLKPFLQGAIQNFSHFFIAAKTDS